LDQTTQDALTSSSVPGKSYSVFLLIDRNRIPSFIAFCATAPRVRRSFFAARPAESFAFANARKFFTSSFDQAFTARPFAFAIDVSFVKKAHMIAIFTSKRRSRFVLPLNLC
jgi:hypothetical protein